MIILTRKIASSLLGTVLGPNLVRWYRCLAVICIFLNAGVIADGRSERLEGRVVASAGPALLKAIDWEETKNRLGASETIKLRYFIRGERGDEEQLMHDLRRGRAHIGVISLPGLVSAAPELELLMVPSLFASQAEAEFVYDNYLFELSRELLAQKGLRLIRQVVMSSSHMEDNRLSSVAIVVNRDWFFGATKAQQAALGNAWVRSRSENNRASAGAADTVEFFMKPARNPGTELAIGQAVARIGRRSAEFYAAIMRGKLAFSAR